MAVIGAAVAGAVAVAEEGRMVATAAVAVVTAVVLGRWLL